jgi:hypothetical protein
MSGRPSGLTKEVIAKIKEAILEGFNLKQFAEQSKIPYSTLTGWTYENVANISDKIEGWKRDRKLKLADKNIEEILQLPTGDKDFVKTVSDMSKFVKETLDKKNYSKRSELTGKDGESLTVKVINYGDNSAPQLPAERVPDTTTDSTR